MQEESNKLIQQINIIDSVTNVMDKNAEMRRELEADRREEARIENLEYKEECREEKIDW